MKVNPVKHFLYDSLRFIGMRDRLRCPHCKSVGAWKPHGGVFDREDIRKVKRWLCKWCGYYEGPEAYTRAYVDVGAGCWAVHSADTPFDSYTPETYLMTNWPGKAPDPWRG